MTTRQPRKTVSTNSFIFAPPPEENDGRRNDQRRAKAEPCSVHRPASILHSSEVPRVALVAALAVGKVVAAEGAAVVVARHAALRARRGVVHERLRRSDLPALPPARQDVVAVVAAQALARVLGVAEVDAEGGRGLRRPSVAAEAVAGVARADFSAAHLRVRRVAGEAGRVRREARRYRERDAAPPLRAVAGVAAGPGPRARARVGRVVEEHGEAAQARERLDGGRLLRVGVADRADGARRVGELLRVAAGAGGVPGRADGPRRVVAA